MDEDRGIITALGYSEESDSEEWLFSFTDLCTLLLCFFIMLLAMSDINVLKSRDVLDSLRRGFNVLGPSLSLEDELESGTTLSGDLVLAVDRRQTLNAAILEMTTIIAGRLDTLDDRNLKRQLLVISRPSGVTVRVEAHSRFEDGTAAMRAQAEVLVDCLAELLRRTNYQLFIEAHTDDVPSPNERYGSNWDLSSARASTLLRQLVQTELIRPNRLAATGYADSRKLSTKRDEAGRSKNRRIEFVFRPDMR